MPPISDPNYFAEMQGQQEQTPNDFWARLAQGAGSSPFGQPTVPNKPTGLEVLLAIAQGFGNAKAGQGARRVDETQQRNAQAREAAKTLATWRHDERKAQRLRMDNRANLLETRAYNDKQRNAVPSEGELAALRARQEAISGGRREGSPLADSGPSEYTKTMDRLRAFKDSGVPARGSGGSKKRGPTGLERSAMAFYLRGKESLDTISATDSDGKSIEQKAAESGVLSQGQMRFAPNWMQSGDQQRYVSAQRAFTEARLRKESGAAINKGEYETDSKTYFVQPGDRAKTIKQKQRLRAQVLDGLKFQAGPAYNEYYTPQDDGGGDVRWVMDDAGNLVQEK
jgi:hypothetical protein